MLADWKFLNDDGIDISAEEGVRLIRVRVAIAVLNTMVFATTVGIAAQATWFGAILLIEAIRLLTTQPLRKNAPLRPIDRLGFILVSCVSGALWSIQAILVWRSGLEAGPIYAVTTLCAVLIHAQSFSFRSKALLIATAGPPGLTLLIVPVFFGGFKGTGLLAVTMGVTLDLLYITAAARANLRAAEGLKNAERRAVEASVAKSSFLAMMSHELRTPMSGVLGMAQALKISGLDEQQTIYADLLLEAGDGLLTILNDILDISKIEAGKLTLDEMPLDLPELANGVYRLWSEVAGAKGVTLARQIDPATPTWIMGDPVRIRQIILNLMSNALKFTERGSVTLAIRPIDDVATDTAWLEIAVSDSGIGMSAEQQQRLFQSFSQVGDNTTKRFGGTGLGLSICKQLTKLMGGGIMVESQPGQGTTFRVTLPLHYAPVPAPKARSTSSLVRADIVGSLAGYTVLVADDNAINRAVAGALLEVTEATVEMANHGEEALAMVRAKRFDLVLMDLHMPVMDGTETVKRIRSGEAGRKDLPVIALTADVRTGQDRELLVAGFDAVQPKPFHMVGLIAAIKAACPAPAREQRLSEAV